jgi:hypothetical protein
LKGNKLGFASKQTVQQIETIEGKLERTGKDLKTLVELEDARSVD